MHIFWTTTALSLYASAVLAQHNVTVNDTDPSIQYQGGVGDAELCKFDVDGHFLPGQSGCYNVPSNCTQSVAMGQSSAGAALLTFQGSAIYINSLLFDISPLYTVTLDGTATDVDGVRPSSTFICETLFSRTGLDPKVNHTISLTIKGLSTQRNLTGGVSDNALVFSLINFIYTAEDSEATSNNSKAPSNASNGVQAAVLGLHHKGQGFLLVLLSLLLSGAHWS